MCQLSQSPKRVVHFLFTSQEERKKEKEGLERHPSRKICPPLLSQEALPTGHSLTAFFPLPRPTLSRSNCLGSRTEPPSPPHPRPTSRLSSVPRIPVHEIQRKEEKKEPLPPSSSGVRFVWQRVGLRSAGRSAKMPRQMEGRRRMGEVSSEERQKKEWRRRRKGVEIRATLRPEGKRVKEEERRKEGKA